jgi:hypothetical protein
LWASVNPRQRRLRTMKSEFAAIYAAPPLKPHKFEPGRRTKGAVLEHSWFCWCRPWRQL